MKATHVRDVKKFTDIPNIGPAMEKDFRVLGITSPDELAGKDPYALYLAIGRITGYRHDPCVLDTYIAAIDFMNGAKAKPWWNYTKARKEKYPHI